MTIALDRLEAALACSGRPEPMLASEFDGFVGGLHLCAGDETRRGAATAPLWLGAVWGGEELLGEAGLDAADRALAEAARADLSAHYERVGAALATRGYAPLIERDLDGSPLWEIWAAGFAEAMARAPEAFARYRAAESETTRAAMGVLDALVHIAATPGAALDEAALPPAAFDAEEAPAAFFDERRARSEAATAAISGALRALHAARDAFGPFGQEGACPAALDAADVDPADSGAAASGPVGSGPADAGAADFGAADFGAADFGAADLGSEKFSSSDGRPKADGGAMDQAAALSPPPAAAARREAAGDTTDRASRRLGRNDPCPCGSGRKYKKCCLRQKAA